MFTLQKYFCISIIKRVITACRRCVAMCERVKDSSSTGRNTLNSHIKAPPPLAVEARRRHE
nr:MAG TPA: hypothetical protein [Caudoviricetes sp.]